MKCTQDKCHHPALVLCDSCGDERCVNHAEYCKDCGKTHCCSVDAMCASAHECNKIISEVKSLIDMVFEQYDKNMRAQ